MDIPFVCIFLALIIGFRLLVKKKKPLQQVPEEIQEKKSPPRFSPPLKERREGGIAYYSRTVPAPKEVKKEIAKKALGKELGNGKTLRRAFILSEILKRPGV